jgi:hypothetical protein
LGRLCVTVTIDRSLSMYSWPAAHPTLVVVLCARWADARGHARNGLTQCQPLVEFAHAGQVGPVRIKPGADTEDALDSYLVA